MTGVLRYGAIALAIVVASCSWGREGLVGKWRSDQGTEILEFLADGTLIQSDENGPLIGGRFERIDEATIRVSFGGPAAYGKPSNYGVALDGDTLDVTGPSGVTKRYLRLD